MGGKRFGVGDAVAIFGAVGAGVGLVLYWWVLQVDAKEGHLATLSYSGAHYPLAWVAAGLAWIAGVTALLKLAGALKPGRVGALVVLALGVAAAGMVGIAIAAGPSADSLHEQATSVFSQKTADELTTIESGKTDLKGSVEYGIGLWVTLAAGGVVALGGLVKLATEKAAPAWQYGAPPQQAPTSGMPYGQVAPAGYAPPVSAGPTPGFAAPPAAPAATGPVAPSGPAATGFAPPVAPPVASPIVPATEVASAPVAPDAEEPLLEPPATAASFCGTCGAPFGGDVAKFCMKCGAARPGA